jgi:DNA-binding transcriptional ArsR family regulator
MARVPQKRLEVECIREAERAAALLDPIRRRIMEEARAAASATEIAARMRLPRQKVNYHVRELAAARLLRKAGQRRKRNMIEQQYVTTAKSYLLDPSLLGDVAPDPGRIEDRDSAGFLLAAAARLQSELARGSSAASTPAKRLPSMAEYSEVRFESAQQRARFLEALGSAVSDLLAKHTAPGKGGRTYRVFVGCCPIPPEGD